MLNVDKEVDMDEGIGELPEPNKASKVPENVQLMVEKYFMYAIKLEHLYIYRNCLIQNHP